LAKQELKKQGVGGFGLGTEPFSQYAPCPPPLALRHGPRPFQNRKEELYEDNNFHVISVATCERINQGKE